MSITVYTFSWNEALLMGYFLRHYCHYIGVDRVVAYDNGSTDGTVDITQQGGAEIRRWDTGGKLDNDELRRLKNEAWKDESADWVIVCDVDELLWHPDPAALFRRPETILDCPIHQMVMETPPPPPNGFFGQLWEHSARGMLDKDYGKLLAFRPGAIDSMNYFAGAHRAEPKGRVKIYSDPSLMTLHYRYLGLEWTRRRYEALKARRVESQSGYAVQYLNPPDEKFRETLAKAVSVFPVGREGGMAA